MPQGPGTYGTTKGRPPTKKKEKVKVKAKGKGKGKKK